MTSTDCKRFPSCPFSDALCGTIERILWFFAPRRQKQICATIAADMQYLSDYLSESGKSADDLAVEIGDSPLRLYRVLNGEEPLGITAKLAIQAIQQQLPVIDSNE